MNKREDIEYVKFEDAPESWDDRCSGMDIKELLMQMATVFLLIMAFQQAYDIDHVQNAKNILLKKVTMLAQVHQAML